jgi:D-beta-D-heptose 7-phosphate kinase/D-beta-D-heptose 1-phosphate adenosyltransferase
MAEVILEEKLLNDLNSARKTGKKIGLVQGSWDLFHVGHLRYIKKAKELCDFLIIGIDDDDKIRKRKGENRPIIPLVERKEFVELLEIADAVVPKGLNEPKWGLIKTIKPDVLIAIKDNYTIEEINKLEEICGKVAILPRQAQDSASDIIRRILISDGKNLTIAIDKRIAEVIETMKQRTGLTEIMNEPLSLLFENLKKSTDWICPVSAGCFWNGKWYFGANQIDLRLSKYDIDNRTELFYSTIEYAEINLLKKLGDVDTLNVPIWTTLFPGDRSLKVLKDKGVKEIYYLEDHPERNWSKRAHELAAKYGIKAMKITEILDIKAEKDIPDDKKAINKKIDEVIEAMRQRTGLTEVMSEPLSLLFENLKKSTDWVNPVAAGCFWNGKWYFGTNQVDPRLSKYDIEHRTELYYSKVEHAEINLLMQMGEIEVLNVPIWVTLFPCDKCMKVLNDKGVKEIYYLEDHPERNWSKRSHELAAKYGIKTTRIMQMLDVVTEEDIANAITEKTYKFIDPKNVRFKSQLDIMLKKEADGQDPLDPEVIDQPILFETDFWYVSQNRFPYDEIEYQFLIASRYPIYKPEDMTKEMWIDLKNVWRKLVLDFNIPGGALCYRFGDTNYSGASLTRLHSHLIMPKQGYKTKFTIGGNDALKKELHL